jgi:peptidoglycan/LPS O-acetylase OafA/YrhL
VLATPLRNPVPEPTVAADGATATRQGPVRADRGRLRALDGLRLTVALLVALFHYLAVTQADRAWGENAHGIFPRAEVLAPYGWLGVEIFFVISGFVICMSSWGRTAGDFLRSRICRLYPAYWVAVCLTYVVISVAPVLAKSPSPAEALVNLTMLQEPFGATRVDGVYWTLWVELRFYLLFALVVWGGLDYRRVMLFGGAWTVLSAVAENAHSDVLTTALVPEYSSYFLVGIGLYLVHRFGHHLLTWLLIGVNAGICLWHAQGRLEHYAHAFTDLRLHYWVVALVLVAAGAFILAIARGRLRWMRWGWLTHAGALTYPFYLLHQVVGYSLIRAMYVDLGWSAYVVLPATFLAVLLLAWVVHRFLERPLAAVLKRQLARRLPA